MGGKLLVIALLVACSGFFSVAEIALASSRRLRLHQLADQGDARAERVLAVQAQPGNYFTVVQVGQNMLAILGGVVGEDVLSPPIAALLVPALPPASAAPVASVLSFVAIMSAFILFADLFPRRLAMAHPEQLAIHVLGPMRWLMRLLLPAVWVFKGITDVLMRVLGISEQREDRVTPDDILALAAAGTRDGVLHAQEQEVIQNVFELATRTADSAMTPRDRIVYFLADDDEAVITARIAQQPHSTYLVCEGDLDRVIGYVDTADLFALLVRAQPIRLRGEEGRALLHKVLFLPDRISLSNVLAQFRQAHEDFAVVVNEYGLVLGVITLNDVMSTVMGSLVDTQDEGQIVRREDGSWLMDGLTPMADVLRAIGADGTTLPSPGRYDTLAGLLMALLHRVPRRTDSADWNGFRFEVLDVDSLRIDQVLVTAIGPSGQARRRPQEAGLAAPARHRPREEAP